jgi:hypothetical protein
MPAYRAERSVFHVEAHGLMYRGEYVIDDIQFELQEAGLEQGLYRYKGGPYTASLIALTVY